MINLEDACFQCTSCNWIGNKIENSICPNCGKSVIEGFFTRKEPKGLFTYDPVYVEFLDILGFKSMVKNNSIQILFDVYKKYLRRVEILKEVTDSTFSLPVLKDKVVNSLFVSDSLILWTEDFSQTSLYKLIGLISLFLSDSFSQGTPLRGAIDMGEIAVRSTYNNQTIVGRGLTNAYEIESIQDWAGCIVSENCVNHFNDLSSITGDLQKNYLQEINLLIKYPIPIKENQVLNGFAVNWLSMSDPKSLSKNMIIESFNKFNKEVNDLVQVKIENTLKFYDLIQNKTFQDYVKEK